MTRTTSQQMPRLMALLRRMREVEELGVIVGAPGEGRAIRPEAAAGAGAQEFGAITSADTPTTPRPRQSDAGYTQGQLLAIHEYGSPERNIPERSVLRSTLREQRARALSMLAEDVRTQLANEKVPVARFYQRVAVMLEGEVKRKFGSSDLAPNAPSTIAAKGSSKPLIDTGELRRSIEGRVVQLRDVDGVEVA